MKSDDLIRAMNSLDEDLVQRADAYRGRVYKKGMRIPVALASVAAVILLILIGARVISHRENNAPGSTGQAITGNTEAEKADVLTTEEFIAKDSENGEQTTAADKDPETVSESEVASGEFTETTSVDPPASDRTVPDIKSLTEGVYSFAEVKDVTDQLTDFTYEELEKTWGVPGGPLVVENEFMDMHVYFWRSGEYSLDVNFSGDGRITQAVTYRTEDKPTIW